MTHVQFNLPPFPNRPNLPYLRSAIVQIEEELSREPSANCQDPFSPFGTMEGFLYADPNAEMVKSLKLRASGVGIVMLRLPKSPQIVDLPKLTASAAKVGPQPPKSKPVKIRMTPAEIELIGPLGKTELTVSLDRLHSIRIDNRGRFFLLGSQTGEAPPCFKATPWVVPAMALLMVAAARREALCDLLSEFEAKSRMW
jgi:hypothetical protein